MICLEHFLNGVLVLAAVAILAQLAREAHQAWQHRGDPEWRMQERGNVMLDLWLAWFDLRCEIERRWFLRRECMDCREFIGGNPRSKRVSHGLCGRCYERRVQEIVELNDSPHGATEVSSASPDAMATPGHASGSCPAGPVGTFSTTDGRG